VNVSLPDVTPSDASTGTDSSGEPTDPVGDRYMSVDDITAAYADKADWFARLDWVDRLVTGRYRKLFSRARGQVLDVACGTGVNFRYLPRTVDIVGIDASPEMLAHARATLEALHRDGSLARMDAQRLAFADDRFDTVISSLSTCTFPDPIAALREMERVCDPDGRILLFEHGRSDVELIADLQEWHADSHYASVGCRWTQEPLAVVERAGLDVVSADTGLFGLVTTMEIRPR